MTARGVAAGFKGSAECQTARPSLGVTAIVMQGCRSNCSTDAFEHSGSCVQSRGNNNWLKMHSTKCDKNSLSLPEDKEALKPV